MSYIIDDIREAFLSSKAGLVRGLLKKALKRQVIPLSQVLNLIIELLHIDNLYFIYKIYRPIIIFLEESKNFDLIEVETYILQKIGFFKDEVLLNVIHGNLHDSYCRIEGRIYVTNHKIIASGKKTIYKTGWEYPDIVDAISDIAITPGDGINSSSDEVIDPPVLEWGYYYPIGNAFELKKTESYFSYFFYVPIKGSKERVLVKIIPEQARYQTRSDFIEERAIFLSRLENIVLSQTNIDIKSE